jgi:PAS domain S-box-containing protein
MSQGLSHFELFPEVPDRWRVLLKRGIGGESLKCEEDQFPRRNGSIDWVKWELTPWRNETGQVGGIIIFSEVITERKKAEEKLHQTEERYRLFFEAIHETLLIMGAVKDSNGKIIDLRFIDLNRQAEKEYGRPRNELIGRLRSEVVSELDEDSSDIINRVLVKKELIKVERYVPLFKKWYEIISYSPLPDQMIVLGIDLTHRKEQDNDLRRANNKLRQRTKTLQKLNAELRDLAYISSHHLQEPLRKLQTFVSLLQKSQTNSPDTKGKEFLSNVVMEASIARERVEDLLFFINLNINKRKKAPLSLMVLLKNVLDEMGPEIEEVQGTVELLDEPPAIYGDPDMIKHLFHQMISNALKFHKPGIPPHIKIHSAITAESKDGHPVSVQIHFEDNGIGIDQSYIPKLFAMFKKLDKESSGSGVGLAVSRKICNLHQGDLTIESTVGEGSIFTVTLPLRSENIKKSEA